MSENAAVWMEYTKLAISTLTPLLTGMIGLIVLRLGNRIEHSRQLNQVLLNKRLSFFEDVAPQLNDIFCFYHAVGHWSELNPQDIIKRKRAIDRAFFVNQFLFDDRVMARFNEFQAAHFETFAAAGEPAKLRLNAEFVRTRIGSAFQPGWSAVLSSNVGDIDAQNQAYQALMDSLGREVKGDR